MEVKERRELEKEQRRQNIIDAALKLFKTRDYHQVSIEMIAQDIGLGKGTIYYYFKSKEEILVESILDLNTKFKILFKNTVSKEKSLHEILLKTAELMFDFFLENGDVFAMFRREVMHPECKIDHKVKMQCFKMHDDSLKEFANFLQSQFEAAAIHADGEIIAGLLFSTVVGFSHKFKMHPNLKIIKAQLAKSIEIIYKGLKTAA